MKAEIKIHKKRFDRDLRHLKIILARQRGQMIVSDWLCLVNRTKKSILDSLKTSFVASFPPERFIAPPSKRFLTDFLKIKGY